jgi:predicted O-linked N-acetylglucosamine transferase (SPINDLY family)
MPKPLQSQDDSAVLQELLGRAMAAHQHGDLAEAERLYRRVLEARPDQFEAQHLLGVLCGQQGRYAQALELVGAALKIRPDMPGALSNYGLILHKMKRHPEALASYDRALAIRPDNAEALSNRGNVLSALERYEEALASYDRALAIRPNYAEALNNRGLALEALGRNEEALRSYVKALLVRPDYAEALYHRGNVLARLERYEEALRCYDKAVAVRPDYAEAYDNRGNALAKLKRYDEALASYDEALALRPDYVGAWYNCGHMLAEAQRLDEALASYDRALAIRPEHIEALNGRGSVLHELGRSEDALLSYDRALALNPDNAEVLFNRGGVLQELNRHDEALASFDKVLTARPRYAEALYARGSSLHVMNRWQEAIASYEAALTSRPDYPEAKFALCMAELPILYANESEIAGRRAAYAKRLDALSDQAAGTTGTLAKGVGSHQPFYLAYQGCDDRDLQSVYGSLVCRVMAERYEPPVLPQPPRPDEQVRLGIVSGFFRQHANWNIPIKGWLSQLDRQRFRVFGYHTGYAADAQTAAAAALCERFVQGPLSVDHWREEIARDAPHVLIYPEVGMDPMAARLAAQRLAPVQCNSWGHPDTSGFPTLDYFLSSALMEPPDAARRYTERLVSLPSLSVYCEPTPVPQIALDRSELGLRQTASVYWCGQSLYKYLPQFDQVFPRIAREVADCQFAFVEYQRSAEITEQFRARLDRAFATFGLRAADYCVLLPRLDRDRFIAATGLSDVFLDSIGWSGCNSTLEALTHDLPIVTMAGALMRGRHTAAMLAMMGMGEAVSDTIDDYVAAAVRLARDVAWRTAMKARLSANKHRLYRDGACVVALEEFLDRVARAESGPH